MSTSRLSSPWTHTYQRCVHPMTSSPHPHHHITPQQSDIVYTFLHCHPRDQQDFTRMSEGNVCVFGYMYVLYVCVCICVYVFMHMCMHKYKYKCLHVCMCLCVCIYVFILFFKCCVRVCVCCTCTVHCLCVCPREAVYSQPLPSSRDSPPAHSGKGQTGHDL